MNAESYPQRQRFFAHKFVRLMMKSVAAQEVGPEGFTLLTAIAMTEDAKQYRGAVSFFNIPLIAICGFASEKVLIRVRDRCIRSGWLKYQPGRKSVPGKYWVAIPEQFESVQDGPVDEVPSDYKSDPGTIREQNGNQCGQETVEKRARNGHQLGGETGKKRASDGLTFNPIPVPEPLPNPRPLHQATESPGGGGCPDLEENSTSGPPVAGVVDDVVDDAVDGDTPPAVPETPEELACRTRADAVRVRWNAMAMLVGLPICKALGKPRRESINARMREPFFRDNWTAAIDAIPSKPFLLGMADSSPRKNGKPWKADIDWFLRQESVTRIMEGKYDDERGSDGRATGERDRFRGSHATTRQIQFVDDDPGQVAGSGGGTQPAGGSGAGESGQPASGIY